MKRYAYLMASTLLMSGCSSMFLPSQDMQGHDPREYYAKNPVENKIEIRHALYTIEYPAGHDKLSSANMDELMMAFSDVSPAAAESVRIRLAPSQMRNVDRRDNLAKFLRNMGFEKRLIKFEAGESVRSNEADIDVTYAAVVLPHCPDWRTSPVNTHSNTKQGNIGCASVVNLGLMVADPHDLVRGEGQSSPDSERNAVVIRRYREGGDPASSEPGESGGGSSDASSGVSASPSSQ